MEVAAGLAVAAASYAAGRFLVGPFGATAAGRRLIGRREAAALLVAVVVVYGLVAAALAPDCVTLVTERSAVCVAPVDPVGTFLGSVVLALLLFALPLTAGAWVGYRVWSKGEH